jgi:hypothetical protein
MNDNSLTWKELLIGHVNNIQWRGIFHYQKVHISKKYISLRKETKAMAEKEKNKSKIELKSLTLLFYSEAIKEKK